MVKKLKINESASEARFESIRADINKSISSLQDVLKAYDFIKEGELEFMSATELQGLMNKLDIVTDEVDDVVTQFFAWLDDSDINHPFI